MDHRSILELMERFAQSGLTRFHWETEEGCLSFEKTPSAASPEARTASNVPSAAHESVAFAREPLAKEAQDKEVTTPTVPFRAPLVGTFYAAAEAGAEPYVREGDPVSEGQIVGIIEAMKMMNYLEAPLSGIVRRIAAQNGELLGFDDLIMEIEPHDD